MNVCITGGTGYIGHLLAMRLRGAGAEIRVLTRKKICTDSGIDYFTADLSDQSCSLRGFFNDADVVFHCAGEINNPAAMRSIHVQGTGALLGTLREHIANTKKAIHWVQLSSVGAYGPPHDRANSVREVFEETPTAPIGEYEITKTISDKLVMDFAKTEPLFTYSILRPSIVVGENMTNQSVRSLVRIIRKRLFFYIGSEPAVATYIHIDDVVDALILCANDSRAKGQIFNLSNDCMLSDIVDAVSLKAGVNPPKLHVPERAIRIFVKFISLFVRLPLTPDRIDAMVKRTRYPNQKIKAILGFAPRHSIPETIAMMFHE
jgi:nucleoside-diphosphate-sugar epimerase